MERQTSFMIFFFCCTCRLGETSLFFRKASVDRLIQHGLSLCYVGWNLWRWPHPSLDHVIWTQFSLVTMDLEWDGQNWIVMELAKGTPTWLDATDSNGRWIECYIWKFGVCDALQTKMWGIYIDMYMAWRDDISNLVVKSDSKIHIYYNGY